MQALKAEVKLAQKRLNDATVRAPFDGSVEAEARLSRRVLEREHADSHAGENESAAPSRGPAGIALPARSRVGHTLTFTTDAAPGETFTAVVRELNPSLDPKVPNA